MTVERSKRRFLIPIAFITMYLKAIFLCIFNLNLTFTRHIVDFYKLVLRQGSKLIFGLESTCATRCKFLGARWTPSPRLTFHSQLLAESSKNRKGSVMEWKQCAPSSEKPQGKTTDKTGLFKEIDVTLLFGA